MIVFLQISGEMWIVKIFSEEEKAKGSIVFDIGLAIGGFLFYNIFVPLNSVDWLNQNFYKSNPRTVPLVSHRMAILTIMGVTFINSVIVMVYVAEKKSHVRETKPTLGSLIKLIPKFFTHTNMRNYMIFLFMNRAFSAMINESMVLKLLDSGVQKTTLVNIDTLTFPIYLAAVGYMMKYVVKGRIMKTYWWLQVASMVSLFVYLFTYIDLKANLNINRTVIIIIISSILTKFIMPGVFNMGYVNTITPEEIGSTFITTLMCWLNFSNSIPSTIGLKLVS